MTRRPRRIVHGLRLGWAASPRLCVQLLLIALVKAIVPSVELWMSMRFVDAVVQSKRGATVADVMPSAIILGVLFGLDRVLAIHRQNQQSVLAHTVELYADGRLIDLMARVDVATFEDPAWQNQMERARRAPMRAGNLVFDAVDLVTSLVGLAAMMGLLGTLHPLLIALSAVPALPLVSAQRRTLRALYQHTIDWAPKDRERVYIADLLGRRATTKEIRAFGLETHFVERFRVHSIDRLAAFRAVHRRGNVLAVVGGVGMFAVVSLGYWFIGSQAIDGRLTAGALVAAIGAFAAISAQTGGLAQALVALQTHAAYLDDYFACLRAAPRLRAPPATLAAPGLAATLTSGLVIEGLRFAYAGGLEVLRGIDLHIAPGELVAIVGDNGAGKSTLVSLILKFYEPTAGRLTLGDVDIAHLDPRELRGRIGVLFQDFARYELAMRDNVRVGRIERHGSDDDVRAALDSASAATIVGKLRDGLDAKLGHLFEGAQDLSGGEWQRVALARLMYRRADLWILDEPTSNLDPEAEAAIFAELKHQLAGRMAIVISHRFSTVRAADRIYVLQAGQVIESGTHTELHALGGRYAALFEAQAAGFR